jgi:hypothetical protein
MDYITKQLTRYAEAWTQYQDGEISAFARDNLRRDAIWRMMSYLNLFEQWGLPSDCDVDLSLRSAVVQHVIANR